MNAKFGLLIDCKAVFFSGQVRKISIILLLLGLYLVIILYLIIIIIILMILYRIIIGAKVIRCLPYVPSKIISPAFSWIS